MVVRVMGEISRVVVTGGTGFAVSRFLWELFVWVIPFLFCIIFVQEGLKYLDECGFYAS